MNFELTPFDAALLSAAGIAHEAETERMARFDLKMARRRADAAEQFMRANYDLWQAEKQRCARIERRLRWTACAAAAFALLAAIGWWL